MNFKIGDTVMLKSGGPLMTVENEEEGGRVMCKWFDEKNKPFERVFDERMLVADDGIPSFGGRA